MASPKDYIFVKQSLGLYAKIFHKDITHIKSDGDYCKIYAARKIFQVGVRIKGLQDHLPPDIFFRCHRCFIVNVDRIETISDQGLYIDSHFIQMSDGKTKQLLKMLNYVPTLSQGKALKKQVIISNTPK